MILPVNFILDRDTDGTSIVFSTGEGDKLDAVGEGRVITFEVDEWSWLCRRDGASSLWAALR